MRFFAQFFSYVFHPLLMVTYFCLLIFFGMNESMFYVFTPFKVKVILTIIVFVFILIVLIFLYNENQNKKKKLAEQMKIDEEMEIINSKSDNIDDDFKTKPNYESEYYKMLPRITNNPEIHEYKY